MKTNPERSVEEREWILSVAKARDISISINDADYIASHYLRLLQAERQKREEVVVKLLQAEIERLEEMKIECGYSFVTEINDQISHLQDQIIKLKEI